MINSFNLKTNRPESLPRLWYGVRLPGVEPTVRSAYVMLRRQEQLQSGKRWRRRCFRTFFWNCHQCLDRSVAGFSGACRQLAKSWGLR